LQRLPVELVAPLEIADDDCHVIEHSMRGSSIVRCGEG
jgi:hypothetical protein